MHVGACVWKASQAHCSDQSTQATADSFPVGYASVKHHNDQEVNGPPVESGPKQYHQHLTQPQKATPNKGHYYFLGI